MTAHLFRLSRIKQELGSARTLSVSRIFMKTQTSGQASTQSVHLLHNQTERKPYRMSLLHNSNAQGPFRIPNFVSYCSQCQQNAPPNSRWKHLAHSLTHTPKAAQSLATRADIFKEENSIIIVYISSSFSPWDPFKTDLQLKNESYSIS